VKLIKKPPLFLIWQVLFSQSYTRAFVPKINSLCDLWISYNYNTIIGHSRVFSKSSTAYLWMVVTCSNHVFWSAFLFVCINTGQHWENRETGKETTTSNDEHYHHHHHQKPYIYTREERKAHTHRPKTTTTNTHARLIKYISINRYTPKNTLTRRCQFCWVSR